MTLFRWLFSAHLAINFIEETLHMLGENFVF